MKLFLQIALSAILLCASTLASALTPMEESYIYKITQGTSAGLSSGARSILNDANKNPEVLDVLAEVVLQSYNKGDAYVSAVSYASRALGESNNGRYFSTVSQVASGNGHRKMRKHAKKAAKKLSGLDTSNQYSQGSVDLPRVKKQAEKRRARLAKNLKPAEGHETIAIVTPGMSYSQIMARCGPPTSTTAYVTGKAWIPFNFRGKDTVRTILLYKGQGRVVVSNSSAYTSNSNAIEVELDASEVGWR